MRDWRTTLPNASYRGQPFYIERETLSGAGRQVALHEYAKSEDHDTEDNGRKVWRFKFSAYIVGDTADADAQAFIQVCSTAGTGALQLPVLGRYTVRCTGCDASAEKTRMGYVQLDLEFVEAGGDTAFSVTALGDRIAASLQGGMVDAITSTLQAFAD